MINLYSIYDIENGICLGKNKTSKQVENLLGVKRTSFYKSASRGYILSGKYEIRISGRIIAGEHMSTEEIATWMREWDDTVNKARCYFQHIRGELEEAKYGKALH